MSYFDRIAINCNLYLTIGYFFYTYQCQEKLTEALSEEERQDLGPTNILFEALNLPNYSGRVRTYGFGVCSRDILPRQNRPTQMDFEKLYGFCNSLKSRLEVLEREKIERDKLDREKLERQQTEEVEERQQPKQVSERLQQPEKVAQRQHLEQVVERKQPEKVAESRLPSDKGFLVFCLENLIVCFWIWIEVLIDGHLQIWLCKRPLNILYVMIFGNNRIW